MKKEKPEGNAPFLHLSKGHDALAYPTQPSPQSGQFGYGYSEENFKPEVDGKDKELLDRQAYLTLSVLDSRLSGAIPQEFALTRIFGDPLGQDLAEQTALATIGHKGRGRKGVEDMMKGASPKVTVPTTITQRIRKLTHRGEDNEEREEVELGQ